MSDERSAPPGWVWLLGLGVLLIFVIGVLQILDWIFSWQLLLLAIVGVVAYAWYRGRRRSKV